MSIEAMKQAIDALNEAVAFREGGRQKAIDAITALRTAIQQATQPAEVTDEREAFEVWARPGGYDLRRNAVLGHYSSLDTLRAWEGWQARAILALRPVQVPMDKQDAWDNSPVNSDWEAVDAYLQGIEDAEAHHGITAQAKKEDE